MAIPHIPILRYGEPYDSLDKAEVRDPATDEVHARVSMANVGLIRRDMRQAGEAFETLQAMSVDRMIGICAEAGELFLNGELVLAEDGRTQSPDEYVKILSITSGLPHVMCRANMQKIHYVLTHMDMVLRGLTRGLAPGTIDTGLGNQTGTEVSFFAMADNLGVVLPSNSPGVNSIWLPAVALKIPVVIKPGSEEPWTPWRIVQALIAAGCPKQAFCFYPTTHEGADAIIDLCSRAIIFGDKSTIDRYAHNSAVQVHGPGYSKVVIGEDQIDHWRDHLDMIAASIITGGGRSCINASAIVVPRHAGDLADALAQRLGTVQPRPHDDPNAQLAAFVNPRFAESINDSIESGLKTSGALEVTAKYRPAGRLDTLDGRTYLRPTIIRCDSLTHPLGNTEYLFPFASVVEVGQGEMLEQIGHSLVVTAITQDRGFIDHLLASPLIDRLNLGPIPTCDVAWDQPHEGNLFEFLYKRRAIQRSAAW